jgi:hypothetical protein
LALSDRVGADAPDHAIDSTGGAITIRDVPDEARDNPPTCAGRSLEDARRLLSGAAVRPPVAEVIARARARVAASGTRIGAGSILDARDAERR